jgi:nicotinamidase-related amidase
MKPVLLVIDMQKEFFSDEAACQSLECALEVINAAINLFRSKQLPVVSIQHINKEDHLVRDRRVLIYPKT